MTGNSRKRSAAFQVNQPMANRRCIREWAAASNHFGRWSSDESVSSACAKSTGFSGDEVEGGPGGCVGAEDFVNASSFFSSTASPGGAGDAGAVGAGEGAVRRSRILSVAG